MKAVVCDQFGPPDLLRLREVPKPAIGPEDVLIQVHAAGLVFPDLLVIQDKYQHKATLPFIPGTEVAGVVQEIGHEVSRFREGDRVVARLRTGGFAEYALASENGRIVTIPDDLDFVNAAGFSANYVTAWHGLTDRAALNKDEVLLVLGAAGGIGSAAVQIGKHLGATVIACVSNSEKLTLCCEDGADATINYSIQDLRESVREITGGRGVDVVCDPVGGEYTDPALRTIAWAGRYLVIGFASGQIPRIPLNLPLLKGCSIIGVAAGSDALRNPQRDRHTMSVLANLITKGELRPRITLKVPLEMTWNALEKLNARQLKGKAVIMVK